MGVPISRDLRSAPGICSGSLDDGLASVVREQTLAEARAESQRLLAEASAQAEELRKQGREAGWQEGFAQGRQAGMEAGDAEIRAVVERVKSVAEGAIQARETILLGSEAELVNLALEIARVVVNQEVAQNRESVRPVVERAMAQIRAADTCACA